MISTDLIALAIIAVLVISGGLLLVFQAKKFRARSDTCEKKAAMPKFEMLDEMIRRLPPEQQAEIEAGAKAISAAIESARLKNESAARTREKENQRT